MSTMTKKQIRDKLKKQYDKFSTDMLLECIIDFDRLFDEKKLILHYFNKKSLIITKK